MQKAIKKKLVIVIGLVLVVALLAAVCLYAIPRQNPSELLSTKRYELDDKTEQILVTGLVPAYSFPKLVEESSLIIKGKISEISEAVKIRWVDGGTSHATDVTVQVLDSYRGETPDTVTIRVNGGLIGDVYESYSAEPELKAGETCLFFLYQPNVGGGKNTQGDYYYITGLSQGVFQEMNQAAISENGKLQKEEGPLFINSALSLRGGTDLSDFDIIGPEAFMQEDSFPGDAILSLQTLPDIMEKANEDFPINPDRLKEELLENYRVNLQNDMITEEEYDKLLKQMDEYATIVDDDYQEPADPEAEKEKERLRAVLEQEE